MHLLAAELLAAAVQATEVSPKVPMVGGNEEPKADSEYATKAGMAAVPGAQEPETGSPPVAFN